MPTPLSKFIASHPEYSINFLARQMRKDKGHISRIAAGVISPRPETRLALEVATSGGCPASAWADPAPVVRRDLPSYDFREAKVGDPVLYCAVGEDGRVIWWGPYQIETIQARYFSIKGAAGVWVSKSTGWGPKKSRTWAVPLSPSGGAKNALLLDGLNSLPTPWNSALGTQNGDSGLLGPYSREGDNRPPARIVPADWPHLASYLRNRRFPFNV
jgi:hypothetical protein